jgi:kumamolisin
MAVALPVSVAGAIVGPITARAAAPHRLATFTAIGAAAHLPAGDRVLGPLPGGTLVRADVVLQPRSASQLQAYAEAVSSPQSSTYRHYLTPAGFRADFAPPAEAVAAVRRDLSGTGLTVGPTSANGLVIPVSATASRVGDAFRTGLESVRLSDGGLGRITTGTPSIAAGVAPSVLAIVGLDQIATPHRLGLSRRVGPAATGRDPSAAPASTGGPKACAVAKQVASEFGAFTDDQVAHSYGLDGLYSKGILGKGQTVALFELDTFSPTDLTTFDQCYFGSHHTTHVTLVNIDGGEPAGPGAGEAALDVEDVAAYAPQAHIDVYDAPGTLVAWVDEMAAIVGQDRASVVSVSYGLCEVQMEEGAPGLQQTENILFEEAALQGQSVFVASGDSGSETCSRNDTSDTSLSVSDPASQPFATAVGGTSLKSAGQPPDETVWNDGGIGSPGFGVGDGAGGGGLSTSWPMPAWQAASSVPGVRNSYSTGSVCQAPNGTLCRQVPDVAASGDQLHGDTIVYGGQWATIGGTSASSPKWAAILALTDNFCASEHLSPVGFADPALYSIASNPATYRRAFNDITLGNNDVLGLHRGAYPATVGYDMATGLGSPRVTGPGGTPGLSSELCSAGTSSATAPVLTGISPAFGAVAGGTPVTLTGSNLTGVTELQFGVASVPVTSGDISGGGTHISVTTPPSPTQAFSTGTPVGGVLVAAVGPGGMSSPTPSVTFHYVAGSDASPVPSVYYLSPGSALAGSTVTIYGSGYEEGLGSNTAPAVEFGGVPSAAVTVVSDSELTATLPAEQSGTDCATESLGVPTDSICQVEVTVTNLNGTSATQPILPPPSGVVAGGGLIPAPGTENVPAVTEFDYAPSPVVTSVTPAVIGLSSLGGPFTPAILTITGSGFNDFSLEEVEAVVASDPSQDQSLFIGVVTPTQIQVLAPNLGGPGATTPTSVGIEVVSAGVTSTPVDLSVAPTNLQMTGISTHDGPTTGGTTVTVTGKHLSSVTGVIFYAHGFGLPVSTTDISVLSSSKITFVTPASPPGGGDFQVCNASTCAASPRDGGFRYYEPVQPVVTGFSPSSGSAGGGERVEINGTGLGAVVSVRFGSVSTTAVRNPAGALGPSSTEIVATAPAGTISARVRITVVTLAGTSRASQADFTYSKGAPGPVTDATATARPGAIALSWAAPASDGGSPVTGYSITARAAKAPLFGPPRFTTTFIPSQRLGPSARGTLLPVLPGVAWHVYVTAFTALGHSRIKVGRDLQVLPGDNGYAIAAADGTVLGFGSLAALPPGDGGSTPANPVVAMATVDLGDGYYLLRRDDAVSAFGEATSFGSPAGRAHAAPAVALIPSLSGRGYLVVSASGAVFAFGDALSHGSVTGGLKGPITSGAGTPDGQGYWLVDAAGRVFPFGDAATFASATGTKISGRVVSIMPTLTGQGYWLVTSEGHVFRFGDAAKMNGSTPVLPLKVTVVGGTTDPLGDGYWLVESNGAVDRFGAAQQVGNGSRLEAAAVAISA